MISAEKRDMHAPTRATFQKSLSSLPLFESTQIGSFPSKMTPVSRAARQLKLKLKADEISLRRSQLRANQTNLKKVNAAILRRQMQLTKLREEQTNFQPFTSPTDRILADILENVQRKPKGRRFSLEILVWGRSMFDISPHAWKALRRVLPIPGQSLLLVKFTGTKGVSQAVVDSGRIGELIDLWRQAIPLEITSCPVVLSADAVAFRSVITIHEAGCVEGLKTMNEVDSPDLLSQFLSDPGAFVSFVRDHWHEADSALFAFQLQPLNPAWPCSIIHAMPVKSGKGTQEVVQKLLELGHALIDSFHFCVVGLAFDGDSAFNGLHDDFGPSGRPDCPLALPFRILSRSLPSFPILSMD
jgi:hypothetical protein